MYNVEVINDGGSVFNIKSKDYEFKVDTKGDGITPPDALLASLGSCIGVYIRKYAEGARLGLKGFRIKVNAGFEKEPYYHFKNIDIFVDLDGVNIDERRRDALLNFVRKCPVHNTLKSNPAINIRFEQKEVAIK